jgi:rhamnogalacturonyl hydrolase YesR
MNHFKLTILMILAFALPAFADKPARRTALDDRIDKALAFLYRTQDDDGYWRAGGQGKDVAITGLSVMAFLSAGHVPGEGRYGETIEKGVRAVLKMQQPTGLFAHSSGHVMYHHGICTLMLAEVVGMTNGELAKQVKPALEKAVAIILKSQRKNPPHRGGWRYNTDPNGDSDISVTGWQLMALRAAKNVG